MEIILGKHAGFCNGVKNVVEKTNEILEEYGPTYCLGELAHNKNLIEELSKKGLKIIENIEEAKKRIIIRAHGIPKKIYKKLEEKNIEILDYTCPYVLAIHKIAEEKAKKNYFIVLVGVREHPETIGTISFCGKNSEIVENEEDVEKAIQKFKNSKLEKIYVIAQTTINVNKFNKIIEKIKEHVKEENVEVKNTICNSTKTRQDETAKIAKEVDAMIIIGGKNSSNTKKLYEVAKEECKNTYLIENYKELNKEEINKYNKIGIMAGASTPQNVIDDVIKYIK